MINIFKRFFEKSDQKLVKEIDSNYQISFGRMSPQYGMYFDEETGKSQKKASLTYYLYEDQNRNRLIDVISSEDGDLDLRNVPKDHWIYRNNDYRKVIRPWLDGVHDPNIPTYSSIKKKEFKDELAKKRSR